MLALLAAARGIVLQRTRADWLIVAAAALIILLATTLLSSGMIYGGAVAQSGLQRTLRDAPVRDANLEVSVRATAEELPTFDERIRGEIGSSFGQVGASVVRTGESDSFELPAEMGSGDHTNLAVVAFYDGIEEHASLASGSWPTPGDGTQVAVSEPVAELLGLSVGDDLGLTSRADRSFQLPVRVSGIFAIDEPGDPYWWGSQQLIDGSTEVSSYRFYGPLVTDRATFFSRVIRSDALVHWYAFPHFEQLQIDGIGALRTAISGIRDRLEGAFGLSAQVGVRTRLAEILAAAERSLLVARTGVLILTVQLAVLAGYALLLTAGLLIEQRRVETALLRSRGASTGQVGALALMEGLLIAVPAAVIGPWLAAASLRLLNAAGPLAEIDLRLDPQVTLPAYLFAAIAGVACIVALVLPAAGSARSFMAARRSRGRQERRGLAQRGGLDLALVALAAIAFWQLRHYGAPITASVQGELGLDPFLVAAPAVGLLAGAVLALRLIPLLAQLIDSLVKRTRGLVSSLGAWQIARRPLRYTRSALLLMLAIALGVFAVSYTQTWTDSQRDQAAYQVGADINVSPDRRPGVALPGWVLASAYGRLGGVTAAMPVSTEDLAISRTTGNATLIAVDARRAASVVHLRSDLAGSPFTGQMQQLAEQRPAPELIPLPGEPQRIRLDLTFDLQLEPGVELRDAPDFEASVVVRDAAGLLHRVGAERIDPSASRQQIVIPLAEPLADGSSATPQYPLQLAAVEVRATARPRADTSISGVAPDSSFTIDDMGLSDSLEGDTWQALPLQRSAVRAVAATATTVREADDRRTSDALGMRLDPPGQLSTAPITFILEAAALGRNQPPPLAVVAGRSFLDAVAAQVGGQTQIDVGPERHPATIVGELTAFPTLDPGRPFVVVDLPTLALVEYQLSGETLPIAAWWLAVDAGSTDATASALREPPYSSWAVAGSEARGDALRTDPVALGVIGGLALGFVSAALFAAIGFVVSASVSVRERLGEFALLRALGLSPGQLSGWLTLENGMLVAISLIGGTGLGLLMAWVALPFVTVTQDASPPVPPLIVTIPWGSIAVLEAITLAVLAVMVVLLAVLLRRVGLGTALRIGDE
ncbi:MAG TPA: ABC transporter permease [Candidatus Limnocylindria bacterium]|nr:ABC transporter permease [Candidatus Limnocylindria bacterium]